MRLTINGREREIPASGDFSVDQLLEYLELDRESLVVELNREILTVDRFAATRLREHDVLELVQFVGGG